MKNDTEQFIKQFDSISLDDIASVGGKNASLGEMIREFTPQGVNIPGGFVVTAEAYRAFLAETGLDHHIEKTLRGLDTKNLRGLARRGASIRKKITETPFPTALETAITNAYRSFSKVFKRNNPSYQDHDVDVAVRSSATAEDLPGASFAGEHETFLNVRGETDLLISVRAAMASLFTDRAISYRVDKGFSHTDVALSVGVQKMVRSDKGASGVMFTLDTESGFKDAVLINGSWGLGELIVQGEVTPDEFLVFKQTLREPYHPIIDKHIGKKARKLIYATGRGGKRTNLVPTNTAERDSFVLSNEEIETLARWAVIVESHYSKINNEWTPMDLEWAKDGITNKLYLVQARPETVHARRNYSKLTTYQRTEDGAVLVNGASVGSKIASGAARIILDPKRIHDFKRGEVLITDMTDPDWEPIMKIASAIVTDKGGRTSHAAIVSRELGIPCVVGTERATRTIKNGQIVTVDTTSTDGTVFAGKLAFTVTETDVTDLPKPETKVMINIASPEAAFKTSFLPNEGVGLAREEFIIASTIGIHPMALIEFKKLQEGKKPGIPKKLQQRIAKAIDAKTAKHNDKALFYVESLSYGIAKIVAAFYPKPVIVRFSDFKTNEYRTLLGGELYEPDEENPMLGWRGASRYYHPAFSKAFALECEAIKRVRKTMGLVNAHVMIPFCRTPDEGQKVLNIMASHGLDKQHDSELRIYVMCEIPSNVILADEFLKIFDGMSIGSNDLTQLTVGIDRDGSKLIRSVTNENDTSVRELIIQTIERCRANGKYVGICGQAPSDIPGFAEFLVDNGIESISLNPDTVIATTKRIYQQEQKMKPQQIKSS